MPRAYTAGYSDTECHGRSGQEDARERGQRPQSYPPRERPPLLPRRAALPSLARLRAARGTFRLCVRPALDDHALWAQNLLISRKPSTTGRLYRKHERPTPWDFIPCPPARRIFCGQHVRVVQRRLVHCPGVAGAECGHIFFQLIALADALKEYEASPLSEVRHEQGGHKQPHQPSDRQPRHRSPPPESCAWRAGLSRSKCHQTATATQARALLTLPRRRAIAASPLRFLPACGAVAQLGER